MNAMITFAPEWFNLGVLVLVLLWCLTISVAFRLGKEYGEECVWNARGEQHRLTPLGGAGESVLWSCSCGVLGDNLTDAQRHLQEVLGLRHIANNPDDGPNGSRYYR